MKHMNLDAIEYKHYNDRDLEIPAVLEYVTARRHKIDSALDVGAHHAYAHYAPAMRSLLTGKLYDSVDFQLCEETQKCVDNYFVGDFKSLDKQYDLVMCISTLEHCGMYAPAAEDYVAEQKSVVEHILKTARKYAFLSFPFGAEGVWRPHYTNITLDLLNWMIERGKQLGFEADILTVYNEFPQGREKWGVIPLEEASLKPLKIDRGIQCLGVLTFEHTGVEK